MVNDMSHRRTGEESGERESIESSVKRHMEIIQYCNHSNNDVRGVHDDRHFNKQ